MKYYEAPINSSESNYQIAVGRRQFNEREVLVETHFITKDRGKETIELVVPGYYLSSQSYRDENDVLRSKDKVEPIQNLSERKELSDLLNRGRTRIRKAKVKVEFWE